MRPMNATASTIPESVRELARKAADAATNQVWLLEHFWVVDAARALLSIAFGVIALAALMTTHKSPVPIFVALGVYLVGDGVFDLIA